MADHHQHYYGHQGEEYLEQGEYYDEEQYPYDPSQDRPSFTTYWKNSKEHQSSSSRGPKNIRFVQTTVVGPGGSSYEAAGGYGSGTDTDAGMGSDMGYDLSGTDYSRQDAQSSTSSKASQDKAQLRRAQVRKAQIQHRQRKANYVKQLEQDVAGLRDTISTEQHEVDVLRGENDLMRSHVHHSMGGVHDPYSSMSTGHDLPANMPPYSSAYSSDPASSQSLDYYSMNLAMDDNMNRPSYRMGGPASPGYYQSASPESGQDYYSRVPSTLAPLSDMSSDQTHQAVNYMLAPSTHDPYSYPVTYKK